MDLIIDKIYTVGHSKLKLKGFGRGGDQCLFQAIGRTNLVSLDESTVGEGEEWKIGLIPISEDYVQRWAKPEEP
jgi:hypothetical protein